MGKDKERTEWLKWETNGSKCSWETWLRLCAAHQTGRQAKRMLCTRWMDGWMDG